MGNAGKFDIRFCGIAGALLLVLPMTPLPAAAAEIRGTCAIAFKGSATFHAFSGKGRCVPFTFELPQGASGGRRIPSASIRVPVSSLDTGNARRDARMREMFEDGRYPEIRGTARDVDADAVLAAARGNPSGRIALPVSLALHGIERAETAEITNVRETGNGIVFDLELPVSLAAYNLKPPTVLGIIRVADTVRVRGTFTLDLPPGE